MLLIDDASFSWREKLNGLGIEEWKGGQWLIIICIEKAEAEVKQREDWKWTTDDRLKLRRISEWDVLSVQSKDQVWN